MMKYIVIFFLATLVVINYGCEQELTDTDLPYEEILVIRGIIQAGDIVDSLYVGRTLPYEENINYNWNPNDPTQTPPDLKSYVKDAIVTISNDTKVYTMTYTRLGFYKNDSLIGETGKTYHLHVEWNGKTADAVTTVPETPSLDSVSVSSKILNDDGYWRQTEFTCSGYVRGNINDVLALTVTLEESHTGFWMGDTTSYTYYYGLGSVVHKRAETNNAIPDLFTLKYTHSHESENENRKMVFTLIGYEEAYNKYYLTFGGGENNISFEPRPVAWNVTGEVIGIFIGASQSVNKTYELE